MNLFETILAGLVIALLFGALVVLLDELVGNNRRKK